MAPKKKGEEIIREMQTMNDPALHLAAVDFSEKRIELWEQQVVLDTCSATSASCRCEF